MEALSALNKKKNRNYFLLNLGHFEYKWAQGQRSREHQQKVLSCLVDFDR